MTGLLAASESSPGDLFVGFILLILITALYWLPTILVVLRKGNIAQVAVINGFLGWSGIGWVVALAMAFTRPTQVVHVYDQAPR